jgi:hypothetical protein
MRRIGNHSKDVQDNPPDVEPKPVAKEPNKYTLLPDTSRFDVSKLQSLESKLINIKQTNKSNDFIDQIINILDLFDVNDLKYSHEVVFFVMSECEKFLLVSKSGEQKNDIVVEVCRRFFNDEPALVKLVIELLMHKLPQVKLVERTIRRVWRWLVKKVQTKSSPQSA